MLFGSSSKICVILINHLFLFQVELISKPENEWFYIKSMLVVQKIINSVLEEPFFILTEPYLSLFNLLLLDNGLSFLCYFFQAYSTHIDEYFGTLFINRRLTWPVYGTFQFRLPHLLRRGIRKIAKSKKIKTFLFVDLF